MREYLRDTLKHYGYTTITACDGTEALEKYNLNRNTIDLVLLDVIMPNKNGREVYESIIKEFPDQKILFMSGYTKEILSAKRIHEEQLEFIQKPIVLDELLEKLESILTEKVCPS